LASLFDIGKSAVQAQRQALNVTGQNIANVNTEGYRKRSADLAEVSGTQSGLSSITSQIGLGVNLSEVRRAYNVFLASSSNSSESRFQSSQTFVESMERLENAILPSGGDLSSQITEFFRILSDVQASPGDLAPRAAAIEQGNGLANAFNTAAFVFRDLETQLSGTIDEDVSEVNRLVESLGSVNGKLRSSNLGSSPPNALMDERDRLISEISKKVRITANYSPRFDVTIRVGQHSTGPLLLEGETSYKIQAVHGDVNGVSYKIGSSRIVKTLDDGGLKGLSTALSVIQDTHSQVDALADRLVAELNAAHRNGIDYDGEFGRSMFTARQFEVHPEQDNSQELDISLLTVPGMVDMVETATFRFNGRSGFWTAYNQNNEEMGTGRSQIDLEGVVVKVGNSAVDGDSFKLKKMDGEADRLSFLLTDGRQIAAASNFVVTPNSGNTGSATMDSSSIDMKTPPLASLTDLTNNSLSPVAHTEFLNGGSVAFIPAGIKDLDLASFGKDPSITLNFNVLNSLRGFKFVLEDYTYEASISEQTIKSLRDQSHLADYLNNGFVTLTKKDGSSTIQTDMSLKDLGLFTSGFEGGLKMTGATEFTSGTVTLESDGVVTESAAVVKSGEAASNFRVFTREGRQIAGLPLSGSEGHNLITEANGFTSEAEYRADYLNPRGGTEYRGATISNILPNGYSTIENASSILTADSPASLIQQGKTFNSIAAQTLTFETTGVDNSGAATSTTDGLVDVDIAVQAGVNMKTIATESNAKLEPLGIIVEAKTLASLELSSSASTSGNLAFDLSSGNAEPVLISGVYNNSKLSQLIDKINQFSVKTGITAEVSNDGSKVVLTQAEGMDISISNISGQPLMVNSLDQNFNDMLASNVALNKDTKIIGSLSFSSPRAFKVTSSLDPAQSALSQTFSKEDGGIAINLTKAGSISDIAIDVDTEILKSQSSPDGMNLTASNTNFILSAKMNASSSDTSFSVNTNSLNDVSIETISQSLVSSLRSSTALPSLTGAPLNTLPNEGSQIFLMVGASQYTITYEAGELVVKGPEHGRVFAEIKTTGTGSLSDPFVYQLFANVPGGVLNSSTIELLDGGNLGEFGLASTDTTASVGLVGRSFAGLSALTDGQTKTIDLKVGLTAVQISVSRSGNNLAVNSNNALITPSIVTAGSSHVISLKMNYYDSSKASQGPIRVTPSSNAAAFGFGAADFSVELTESGLKTVSMNGDPSGMKLEVENLPGQILSMSGLPNEDLIVMLDSNGARRLAASFEMSTEEDSKAQKDYRVKVIDGDSGRVELFDNKTGTSIATRFTNGVATFDADGYRFELAGFGSTDDYFDVSMNRSNAGDARNMESIIALSQSTEERNSFQDDFKQIALAVGSQLESGRLLNISALATRDAAIATEDELSGVNLDEEAGKLMEQQQAYKAAAQILQTARDLFDTIIRIM
jgi:flagellar hook-associated protein 1